MKKFIIFLFTTLFILNLNAQQWAKYYTGMDGSSSYLHNSIYNTAYDSQGNIYILGTFGEGATIDGDTLLDYFPHYNNSQSLLIAKLDPNGNMLWRKSIKNGQSSDVYPNYMQIVGDTSVVIATMMSLAGSDIQDYLFYLDTLIEAPINQYIIPGYPFPTSGYGTGFITLDLNGNLIDQHFLQLVSLDSNNAEIVPSGGGFYGTYLLYFPGPIYVDKSGYIYMYSMLSFPTYEETKAYTIKVDGQRNLSHFNLPFLAQGAMLFKFSPNFTDMVWNRDIVVDTVGYGTEPASIDVRARGMAVDSSGGIYVTGYLDTFRDGYGDSTCYKEAIVDTNNPLHRIKIDAGDWCTGFIVKYNNDGDVMWTNQLYGRKELFDEYNYYNTNYSDFSNIVISEENNAAYVIGVAALLNPVTNLYFEDSIPLRKYCDTTDGTIFFAKFNKETGSYMSHGIAPSAYNSSDNNNSYVNNSSITVKNNQVFAQTVYSRHLMGIDTNYYRENAMGLAFIRWKDNGYIIDVKNFPTNCDGNKLKSRNTLVNDNGDMILTGMFNQSIDFGNVSLTSGSYSSAYIVKFNDPSFIVPFVGGDTLNDRQPTPDTSGLNNIINIEGNNIFVYPNPTKDNVYIITQGEIINSFSIYNTNGQLIQKDENAVFSSDKTKLKLNLSNENKGVYIIKIITNKNVYSRKIIVN